MKRIHLVFVIEKDNRYHALAETIRAGENLKPFFERYEGPIAHICETALQAGYLAAEWNADYEKNGTLLY